jgi:hypothetical protein
MKSKVIFKVFQYIFRPLKPKPIPQLNIQGLLPFIYCYHDYVQMSTFEHPQVDSQLTCVYMHMVCWDHNSGLIESH